MKGIKTPEPKDAVVVVVTNIGEHQYDQNIFNAMMYGVIDTEYSVFIEKKKKRIAIGFQDEEVATFFKLNKIDEDYVERYGNYIAKKRRSEW